jgi:Tfp pilus assembly protein PilF
MYKEALRLGPGYYVGDIHNAVGVCLTEMDQYEEALRAFERARAEQATLSFKPYKLYRNMGLCYWHLDRYEEAAEAFKTALGLMHRLDEGYRQVEWYLRQVQARQCTADR